MTSSHPYISGANNITRMIEHLRKTFPQTVTSETIKKLGIASNNESYVINALHFIGIISGDGKKTTEGAKVFSQHKDEEFSKVFSTLIETAYSKLFELHADDTWNLETDKLITFFRQNDQTSDVIGKRQAGIFKVFATLSGHRENSPARNSRNSATQKSTTKKEKTMIKKNEVSLSSGNEKQKNIGLTVRIEINLPSDGTKETYDDIFKSIKENLIDG